jgi:hypothetical protein
MDRRSLEAFSGQKWERSAAKAAIAKRICRLIASTNAELLMKE